MNLAQPLRAILRHPRETRKYAVPLGSGRWHVLFADKARPLLVPADAPPRFQRRFLRLFVESGWKALHARALLRANATFPEAGLLPEYRSVDGGQGFFLGSLVPGLSPHTMVRIGTAGPYQKASVLLVSEEGEAAAVAKIAMVSSADDQLTLEARWLRQLETAPELEHQIPRLLVEGVAPNGRRYVVTSVAPSTRTGETLTPAHVAFLAALGRVAWQVMSFTASPCFRYLEETLDRLEPHMTRAERATLQAALHDCRMSLAGWTGPFVISHGEFAPWNIRLHGDRIYVLDWEYARGGANPLGDALDYLVLPRAISGRGVSPAFFGSALRRVEEVARQIDPEWTWRARAISALGLAYLLEMLLRYSAATRRLNRTHPVVASYFRLVVQRSTWMA